MAANTTEGYADAQSMGQHLRPWMCLRAMLPPEPYRLGWTAVQPVCHGDVWAPAAAEGSVGVHDLSGVRDSIDVRGSYYSKGSQSMRGMSLLRPCQPQCLVLLAVGM